MSNETWCDRSVWPDVSVASGGVSFLTSFVAQIPQLIETYRDKSVEGLSAGFLLCWLFGDITSLFGAVMTRQLPFQILLAVYYLTNDVVICGQYYYYGILHKNQLATPGHESATMEERLLLVRSRGSNPSVHFNMKRRQGWWRWLATLVVGQSGAATAMPLAMPMALVSRAISVSNTATTTTTTPEEPHTSIPGQVFSWVGAMAYFYARIPQLIKNYRRKSTDGLSPLLFVCTLLANVTYTLSIFTSCSFLTSDDKHEFVMNALPFIVGSAGTIVFDLTYFYQHYVLYADDNIIRRLESDEYMPLIS